MSAEPPKPSAELQQFILQEQAKAQLQQTISRLTDECWDKCISSPGRYLSGSETSCLDNCARRFLDVTQFVVKYYQARAQREAGAAGGGFH